MRGAVERRESCACCRRSTLSRELSSRLGESPKAAESLPRRLTAVEGRGGRGLVEGRGGRGVCCCCCWSVRCSSSANASTCMGLSSIDSLVRLARFHCLVAGWLLEVARLAESLWRVRGGRGFLWPSSRWRSTAPVTERRRRVASTASACEFEGRSERWARGGVSSRWGEGCARAEGEGREVDGGDVR